ncbi:MAG: hypothetical protein EA408_09075 [Marinilabiliales bacterium]|nr:MAG: hypothetical protein EA408_09075 [Marinilabiliales bacterium]
MKNQVNPLTVLLFISAVLIVLAAISLFFPPEGIKISDDFRIRFPSLNSVLQPDVPEYADISHLTERYRPDEEFTGEERTVRDTTIPGTESVPPGKEPDPRSEEPSPPSIEFEPHSEEPVPAEEEPAPADEGSLREVIFPLELPDDEFKVLDPFFGQLHNAGEGGGALRIIHYGDSQIENNRITSAFRNRMQARFGGGGTGMFPVISPAPHNASVRVVTGGNWVRYTPLERARESRETFRYGLLMSFCSLEPATEGNTEGAFTLRPTGMGPARSREMEMLTVFTGFNSSPFTVELLSGEQRIDADLIFPSDSLMFARWPLPHGSAEYTVRFAGRGSLPVFSVSIDNYRGVGIDNVPMRGSSGLEFSRSSREPMAKMMELLNVRLLILQFGVNIVPDIADDYTWYENSLVRQINYLKSLSHDISIIVIGVSDMSRTGPGGYYESFPNIGLIRDAQRRAAFRSGAAFWDLYGAMGGKNSMPSWVNADPPLGQADHIHFTFRGSALIGDLLYDALMYQYEAWLENKRF